MKKQISAILFANAWLCFVPFIGQAQAIHVNIMPFGDSVTAFGSAPESSYRYWLWQDLQNAGFTNIDFIGHSGGVADGAPANSDFDQNYEGGGDDWTSLTGLGDGNNAASLSPDIVLLDLGANDFFNNISLGQTETNLETIIGDFAAQNSAVVILIATPTGFMPDPTLSRQQQNQQRAEQSHLAGAIGKVVSVERGTGVKVIKVNLFGGFNPRKDTKDGTHPDIPGEQLIARRYFNALRPILKKL